MKIYVGTFAVMNSEQVSQNGDGGVSIINKEPLGICPGIACSGTTFGAATVISNTVSQTFYKTVVTAIRIDASNVGMVLPQLDTNSEIDIIANSADGGAMTLYAPSGEQFTGGATSMALADGTFKTFRRRYNSTAAKYEFMNH